MTKRIEWTWTTGYEPSSDSTICKNEWCAREDAKDAGNGVVWHREVEPGPWKRDDSTPYPAISFQIDSDGSAVALDHREMLVFRVRIDGTVINYDRHGNEIT
jgi:hypothetical protein